MRSLRCTAGRGKAVHRVLRMRACRRCDVCADMEDLLGDRHPLISCLEPAKKAADELDYEALKLLIEMD